ncbi:hypothetical protein AVEN_90552-1 [Araneus ventricosus]|uniref:Mariner Mos1 transposase n=1 Tax=Araneus ventricosus TaxID=182803 RepID=A0A4Y2I8B2_ARAVE|nr:hypothetical protein AVEN_90552-1 [Araneus ventricosus]
MLCWKQHADMDLDASKIVILMSKIKRNSPEEMEASLHEDSCQTRAELAELGVDHTTVSKCLKALGMIQKQWVPYQLKPRDVEQHLFTRDQLFQRQKKKGFLHHFVIGDKKMDMLPLKLESR